MTVSYVDDYFLSHPQGASYRAKTASEREAAFNCARRDITALAGIDPDPETSPAACWAVAEETLHYLLYPELILAKDGWSDLKSEDIDGVSHREYDAASRRSRLSPMAARYLDRALRTLRDEAMAPVEFSRG